MTDANKYYLDKREAEQEEYDFKDEYEDIAADNVRLEAEVKKYHDAWLEAEAQVVDLEAQVEGCLAVIATERDEVLALRRKLAKAVAFVHDFACRAKTDEHTQDEMWLIDEDTLRYQRDCDITQARTTLTELTGGNDE